jgi:hypothetical protein
MAIANGPRSQCRKCRASITLTAEFCPRCGAVDPGGFKMALVGALVYGGLIAAAVAGLYAWIVHSDWERWERKFRGLPADHPLADLPVEVAVGIGILILLFTWFAAGYLLYRSVLDGARSSR